MESSNNVFQEDRFAAACGIHLVGAGLGHATTRVLAGPEHFDALGTVHGGLLFTLAATAFHAACKAGRLEAVGIALSLSGMRRVGPGVLVAEAREDFRGRRLAQYSARISDADGQTVAVFEGTAYIKGERRVEDCCDS